MKIDNDIVQRGKVGLIFILQFYRITTGTMLSLFVPQSCGDHVCTLTENYEKDDNYHKIAIYMNGFSMFVFFIFYIIELFREEWCVKYLDINNDKSDNNLRHIIEKYPKLNTQMDKINKIYYKSFIFNCIVYFANICVTIKVLNDYYYNSATLSCFTSFVLLVLMKLYSSFIVSYYSIKDDKMSSAYVNEFVSYNVMDSDFLEKQENKIEEINEEDIIPIVN
tara:strand:- start:3723 stop:4388 length:666 start_codon:yes stop_codon:yes gene_type:complete